MGIKKPITEEESKKYLQLLNSGLTQNQASKYLQRSRKCLNNSLALHGLEQPRRKPLASEKIKERYKDYINEVKSVREIAEECSVTEVWVRKIFLLEANKSGSKTTREEKMEAKYKPVVDYLKKHGGYIKHALIKLGIKSGNARAAKKYCQKVNFPYEEYIYAFRKYGYWKSIPGPTRASTTKAETRHIPCECTLCGTVHYVDIVNMISGKSTKCFSCGQDKGISKVKCVETGKEFKTLAEWLRAIDMVPQRTALVKRLRHEKRIEINGLNYRIITPRRRRS